MRSPLSLSIRMWTILLVRLCRRPKSLKPTNNTARAGTHAPVRFPKTAWKLANSRAALAKAERRFRPCGWIFHEKCGLETRSQVETTFQLAQKRSKIVSRLQPTHDRQQHENSRDNMQN